MSRTSRACCNMRFSMECNRSRAVTNWRQADSISPAMLASQRAQPQLGLALLGRGARDLALVAVEDRNGNADLEAEGVRLGVHLLPDVLGAEGVVRLRLRDLGLPFGAGPLGVAPQAAQVRTQIRRQPLDFVPVGDGRVAPEFARDVERRRTLGAAHHGFQPGQRGAHLEFGPPHGVLRLQSSQPRTSQFQFGDLSGLQTSRVYVHGGVGEFEILASQRQNALGEQDVHKSILHVEREGPRRIQELQFHHRTRGLGDGNPGLSLAAALDGELRAQGDFRRASAIDVVKTGAEKIEVIASRAEHRIRAQARGEDTGVGDGDVGSLGKQTGVLLYRLGHRLVERESLGT